VRWEIYYARHQSGRTLFVDTLGLAAAGRRADMQPFSAAKICGKTTATQIDRRMDWGRMTDV